MQARVDWVLIIFGTQVIKKKRPVWPLFPDYPAAYSELMIDVSAMYNQESRINAIGIL